MASSNFFKYTIDQKECILNKFGRTVDNIEVDIESIKSWIAKQPHIPMNMDASQIEHFLLINKFIFDKVKKTIDWYFRIRTVFPNYFKEPDEVGMLAILNQFYFFPLPKMTSTNCRVIFKKMRNPDLDKTIDAYSYLSYCVNIADMLVNHDCPCSKVLVIDCRDIKLDLCTIFSPMTVKTGIAIFEKAYRNGLQEIHLVHLPSLMEAFINFVKSFMNPKVVKRMYIHNNVSSVFEFVSSDIFPKDYGGEEVELEELHKLWKNELMQNLEWFRQRKNLGTNESLRTEKSSDCDLLGFQGNFRKLNVD